VSAIKPISIGYDCIFEEVAESGFEQEFQWSTPEERRLK